MLSPLVCFAAFGLHAYAQSSAYTPQPGSPERTAIMDVMRLDFYDYDPVAAQRNQRKILFKVFHLKIHGNWAFTSVTPLDSKGREFAEPRSNVLHRTSGRWITIDVIKLLGPKTEEEAHDILEMSPSSVLKLQKKIPEVPSDIFKNGVKNEGFDKRPESEEITVRLNLAPKESNPSVFSAPTFQSPHPDQFTVGSSWSFLASKKVTNDQGSFLFGNLISPRGGVIRKNVWVLADEWSQ